LWPKVTSGHAVEWQNAALEWQPQTMSPSVHSKSLVWPAQLGAREQPPAARSGAARSGAPDVAASSSQPATSASTTSTSARMILGSTVGVGALDVVVVAALAAAAGGPDRPQHVRSGALRRQVLDEIDLGDHADQVVALEHAHQLGLVEDVLEQLDLRLRRHRRVVGFDQLVDGHVHRARVLQEIIEQIDLAHQPREPPAIHDRDLRDVVL